MSCCFCIVLCYIALVHFSFCRHNLLVLVPILNYFSISTIIDKYFDIASYINCKSDILKTGELGIYVAVLSSPPPSSAPSPGTTSTPPAGTPRGSWASPSPWKRKPPSSSEPLNAQGTSATICLNEEQLISVTLTRGARAAD